MPRSKLLATATIPDTDTELKLHEHADRFAISIPGRGELMNSRVHGSEIALAEMTCKRVARHESPCILIGGLGMGFTLAATLAAVGDAAEVVVAELVPEVVDWNRELVGAAAGHPLNDPRSRVFVGDVAQLLRESVARFDAVMMDVDNGPEALIAGGADPTRERLVVLARRPGRDLSRAQAERRAGGVVGLAGSPFQRQAFASRFRRRPANGKAAPGRERRATLHLVCNPKRMIRRRAALLSIVEKCCRTCRFRCARRRRRCGGSGGPATGCRCPAGSRW